LIILALASDVNALTCVRTPKCHFFFLRWNTIYSRVQLGRDRKGARKGERKEGAK
jgi:hypothetical protein